MKLLRNPYCCKTPPGTRPKPRMIPEGSRVRRQLFADDGPAEASGNPNMSYSTKANRIMQLEQERAARRWHFCIPRGEPLLTGSSALWNREPCLEDRQFMIRRGHPCRRRMDMAHYTRSIMSQLMTSPDPQCVNLMSDFDNVSNDMMDDSQDFSAEHMQHWNFDFDNKKPAAVGGQVLWKQVGSHWVGNRPGTTTRVVLYPTKTKNGENTLSHEESDEEPKKENANKSALKPTDKIEHLFTNPVNVIYGDWKMEMTAGKKLEKMAFDTDLYGDNQLQHHKVSKLEAIALIRDENIFLNEADDDDDDLYREYRFYTHGGT